MMRGKYNYLLYHMGNNMMWERWEKAYLRTVKDKVVGTTGHKGDQTTMLGLLFITLYLFSLFVYFMLL